MTNCIIPLNAKTAEAIFNGEAYVLPRRVMPKRIMEGERIIFYSEGQLLGSAVVKARCTPSGINIWAVARGAGMKEDELLEHWVGSRSPGYFVLGEARRFSAPRPWYSKIPLQSFMYV